jgi:hypothetical protein
MSEFRQLGQSSPLYVNDCGISNNPIATNYVLSISQGVVNDSTGTFQLVNDGVINVDTRIIGVGGLDNGVLLTNTVYAIYVVWDISGINPDSAIISLSYDNPLVPAGYSAFRRIGFCATDNNGILYQGKWTAGNSSYRKFFYSLPPTVLSSGVSTSFDNVDLSKYVPSIDNTPILCGGQIIPSGAGSAGNAALLSITNTSAVQFGCLVQNDNIPVIIIANALSSLLNGVANIDYSVTSNLISLDLNVASYDYQV